MLQYPTITDNSDYVLDQWYCYSVSSSTINDLVLFKKHMLMIINNQSSIIYYTLLTIDHQHISTTHLFTLKYVSDI